MKNIKATAILMLLSIDLLAQFSMEKSDSGFLIKEGIEPVFFYQSVPKSDSGRFERNNYIHPLWGIDGNILTEDFPADHPHQRGIYWAWHQLWIGDKRVGDGWELKNFLQEIVEIEYYVNKEKNAVLSTEVLWKSPLWQKNGEPKPFVRENSVITVHPASDKMRRIDFEIRLLALEKNVRIGGSEDEKGYGGFSARVILPPDVRFLSAQGYVEPETLAIQANQWIVISGSFGKHGKKGGLIIIGNPQNPGFPEQWILLSSESMQNVAYPGKNPVELPTQKPLVLKYSMVVYKGNLSTKKMEEIVRIQ